MNIGYNPEQPPVEPIIEPPEIKWPLDQIGGIEWQIEKYGYVTRFGNVSVSCDPCNQMEKLAPQRVGGSYVSGFSSTDIDSIMRAADSVNATREEKQMIRDEFARAGRIN